MLRANITQLGNEAGVALAAALEKNRSLQLGADVSQDGAIDARRRCARHDPIQAVTELKQ